MDLTHWKKLDNPDYLGAYALEPGKDLIAVIKSVGQEEVYNPSNNKKEVCTVAHFEDRNIKPMILNVTNCKTISKIYDTPYIEQWCGKAIAIYIAKVKAFGETVEALRIRAKVPSTEKFVCVDCGMEITPACGKTAKELAQMGIDNCGRVLCLSCMRKEKERMDNELKESEDVKNEDIVSED